MRLFARRAQRRQAKDAARRRTSQRLAAITGHQWDLLIDGVVQGRLILETLSSSPDGNGWVFWHIIWADGTTNYPGTEDYGPGMLTLDEVEQGVFSELVITEVRQAALGPVSTCLEQVFTLRDVPTQEHVALDLDAQARNRRTNVWVPAI